MKISVLILNWNGRDWLEKFLPSVVASTYEDMEIVVADNGSTDDSVVFLKENFSMVRVIQHDKNYGFTGGNNRALPFIDAPYIVLLNSDVEVTPAWLEPLVVLMDTDEKIACIQPKIRAYHQQTHFEYAGASGGYIDKYGYPFCRGRVFDTLEVDNGQYEDAQDIFWATGACCMIRKSVIDKIGLFEESFFAHMEEIDFCWRAQNMGYRIMVEPKSVIYHVGGGTLPQGNPRKTFFNVHNSLAMMYKNLPKGQVFSRIFVRLLLDGVWGAQSLLKFDFQTIWAIIRAHFHFYEKLGFWKKRRREIYTMENSKNKLNGVLDKSVVWQYFGKGKKRFSDLGL